KSQIPNSKSQPKPKSRIGNQLSQQGAFWDLELGICLGFRIWDLGFRWSSDLGSWVGSPMITFLHGKLVEALPTRVVMAVNGVGYEALIPLYSYDKLPQPGQELKLLTHLVVREDAHVLYGFMSSPERELFRLLIDTVSGI